MRSKRLASKCAAILLGLTLAVASEAGTTSKYKVLHAFTGSKDGGVPWFGLALDEKGNLYGVTYQGGTGCKSGCGTVFELTRRLSGKWSEQILHNFGNRSEGDGPNGGPALDRKGNLYGAAIGGPIGGSSLYQLRPGRRGWSYRLIYDDGAGLGVLFDKADNIYGYLSSGQYGEDAISELIDTSKGWTLKTLYSFCAGSGCPDGVWPLDPLTWDAEGNLYGTTLYGGNGPPKCGGSLGCGVAFQMTPNRDGTWTYHVLHRFGNFPYDGRYPRAGLVIDKSGTVYGATSQGGREDGGTIFKLTRSSSGRWKQTVLYDFPDCAEGCGPDTSLVFDKAGNLYGTAGGGLTSCGGYYCGLVYKLTRRSNGKWKYSVLHKFTGQDGEGSNGLTIDGKGNLYGTTIAGGAYNYGVAFELMP